MYQKFFEVLPPTNLKGDEFDAWAATFKRLFEQADSFSYEAPTAKQSVPFIVFYFEDLRHSEAVELAEFMRVWIEWYMNATSKETGPLLDPTKEAVVCINGQTERFRPTSCMPEHNGATIHFALLPLPA